MTLSPTGRNERGAATILVVSFAGVLLLIGAALGVATAMVRAHRIAQSGADLAALAAARAEVRGGDACRAAAALARANAVLLTSCTVSGRDVLVGVTAPGPHWLGQRADLSATALAGPADAATPD